MKTTKRLHMIKNLLLVSVVSMVLFLSTTQAHEMQPGTDAYNFSTYMIDAFYSEGESCEEKLLAAPTIGWLCAAFPLGQNAFEQRWEAYLSALPENYSITAVTSWGDIKYAEDDTFFYGKIYDLNDGRLVVGYDRENRGSEIRLGFSSTANQATASQQPAQVQPAQVQPAAQAQQQEPVMLTYEQTRALELAASQAAANQQIQQTATPQYQTQEVTNQRAYATPATQAQQSTAMATATSTNMTNSAVLNTVQAPVQQAATTVANSTMQASTVMTNAANTNLSTSGVVNQQASSVQAAQAEQVQSTIQQVQSTPIAPQVPITAQAPNTVQTQPTLQAATSKPAQTQEVMAMAQSSSASDLGASAILDVFRENGLSVEAEKSMTTKDYGFAPVLANEGLFFRIGDCTSCIGRIFSFDRTEDVAMMEVYYSLEAQATDVVYSQDKVLLQFFSTPKDLAETYISELKALN